MAWYGSVKSSAMSTGDTDAMIDNELLNRKRGLALWMVVSNLAGGHTQRLPTSMDVVHINTPLVFEI